MLETLLVTALAFAPPPQTRMPRWMAGQSFTDNVRTSAAPIFEEFRVDGGTAKKELISRSESIVKADMRGGVINRLLSWAELNDGWDGEDSIAPTRASILKAIDLIKLAPADVPLPKPMLSPSGEVGLYWDLSDRYVDLEFSDSGLFSLYFRQKKEKLERFEPALSLGKGGLSQVYEALGSAERELDFV